MQTETIIVLAVILFVILFLFLHGLAKVRESIEQISKDVKMENDKNWHDDPINETKPTPVHSKPSFPIGLVVDTALKESKKVLDAAEKAKQNAGQQALGWALYKAGLADTTTSDAIFRVFDEELAKSQNKQQLTLF